MLRATVPNPPKGWDGTCLTGSALGTPERDAMGTWFPPGWDWLFLPIIPTVGVLITLGTVVVGLYASLIWLRDTVRGGSVIECEVLVDRPHGGGAFANRGRDALHRARPEVANGEQAGPAGLERKRATTCNLPTVVKMLVIERQVSEHKSRVRQARRSRITSRSSAQHQSTRRVRHSV